MSNPPSDSWDDLTGFLNRARWPTLPKPKPTFFSIAGIKKAEVPLSNVYAFFFASGAAHGLGTLFVEALLDVLHSRLPADTVRPVLAAAIHAPREYPMRDRQRLDILVHNGPIASSVEGATFVVLLENKIEHWQANAFENYWASIPALPYKAGIVLGLHPEETTPPWHFISHLELVGAVEERLGPLLTQANAEYLPVLFHLLENLKQMSGVNPKEFGAAFNYAQQHRKALAPAQQLLKSITPEGLAATVKEAFGPDYQQRKSFDDRVDIQRQGWPDFRYVVFFGDILDLTKSATFTITLYDGMGNKQQTAAWRAYFTALPECIEPGIRFQSWFPYDELVVGKMYEFTGSSLDDLKKAIASALIDWKPLEAHWFSRPTPPDTLI